MSFDNCLMIIIYLSRAEVFSTHRWYTYLIIFHRSLYQPKHCWAFRWLIVREHKWRPFTNSTLLSCHPREILFSVPNHPSCLFRHSDFRYTCPGHVKFSHKLISLLWFIQIYRFLYILATLQKPLPRVDRIMGYS